jgi:hypothetical protein
MLISNLVKKLENCLPKKCYKPTYLINMSKKKKNLKFLHF